MRFRPCIDLHNGKVKQIIGATLFDKESSSLKTNFESKERPAFYSNLYKKYNLTGGHVIMLGEGNRSAAIEALQSYPKGLQVGGGITVQNALEYIEYGASHIIVTSYVFKDGEINWNNLEKLVNLVGKKQIVLDLSCKKRGADFVVVTDRWQKFTNYKISEKNLERLAGYCDEFLIHAADVEGLQNGIDLEIVELLSNSTDTSITYAGGIRDIKDLDFIDKKGQGKIDATIGSALDIFGGELSFESVVNWHKQRN